MKHRETLTTAYVALLAVLGVLLGWYIYQYTPSREASVWLVAAFIGLALIAEALPVRLPAGLGTVSVGFALIYAGVLLFGPRVGLLMGLLGTIDLGEMRTHVRAFVFNRVQLGLAAGCAGVVYTFLGGSPGHFASATAISPMAIGGGTYFVVNSALATLYISIIKGQNPWSIWVKNLQWVAPHYIALVPLAFLIAVSYDSLGILGLTMFFLPLLVARYSLQRYMDMREVFLDTITSLAKALEAKDPYTKGHADRVSAFSVLIARKLGWSEQDVELIKFVGLLHDIGKIGIEDRILNKPGKFTEAEYVEMKRHPRIGARIIEDVKLLGTGAKWVEHHHEWHNGRGYPDGLKGDEIPMGARILAVADAFDAMISHRPYKRSRTVEEARQEIRDFAGIQFDPAVAQAFLDATSRPGVLSHILPAEDEAAAGVDR